MAEAALEFLDKQQNRHDDATDIDETTIKEEVLDSDDSDQESERELRDLESRMDARLAELRRRKAERLRQEQQEDADEENLEVIQPPASAEPSASRRQSYCGHLAEMLPVEYRDVDPRQYFPEFRHNQTLRFSRLFGAGKVSSLPVIWKNTRSTKKKLSATLSSDSAHPTDDGAQPSADGEGEPGPSGSEPKPFALNIAPRPPLHDCRTDDELCLLCPDETANLDPKKKGADAQKSLSDDVAPWRDGPAAYWHDRAGVSDTGRDFAYGFKLKSDEQRAAEARSRQTQDATKFLPVNLVSWENDVILDPEPIREESVKKLQSGEQPISGWIPTQYTRTYAHFMAALNTRSFDQILSGQQFTPSDRFKAVAEAHAHNTSSGVALLPSQQTEFDTCDWESDVILDPEAVDRLPEPLIPVLDWRDDARLLPMPEDHSTDEPAEPTAAPAAAAEASSSTASTSAKKSDEPRKDNVFTKKSKRILGLVEQRRKEEELEMEQEQAKMSDKDPFNLSNDEFYQAKTTSTQALSSLGASHIRHSIPAQNLERPFFPTFWNVNKLRHFHRPPLKRYGRGSQSKSGFHPVYSLTKHIDNVEKERDQQRGGGEMFFMREAEDLSAKDSELLLFEYAEEHPPLLQQPGMASKIKNYHKRKAGGKEADAQYEYGETAFTHNPPFLGALGAGESLQSLENNLYRAPLFMHKPKSNDFLIIRTRFNLFIRQMPRLFVVGQECPLVDVPSPNSKRDRAYLSDFQMAFVYRLFWASNVTPRRIRMEDVKRAFPQYPEANLRKRLKQCADSHKLGPGSESNYWVLKSDFRLPSREEVQLMVSPESCCAHYSMAAAQQRLRDAGYGEKYFIGAPENEDDEDAQLEDEIRCAPWNTTRTFISTMKGKCVLDQTGIADPTGQGRGFSYVRVSTRPIKEDLPPMPKKLVTGTDADLRKLPLKQAKTMLKDMGVKEEEINSLTRWEIIDVIRTLSTQQARNQAGSGLARFARGSQKFNMAEVQAKHRAHCQKQFEKQNTYLSKAEFGSDSDGSGDSDDASSDIDEMARHVESIIDDKPDNQPKSSAFSSHQTEEAERLELQKMLAGGQQAAAASTSTVTTTSAGALPGNVIAQAQQLQTSAANAAKLRIYRTYKNEDGKQVTQVETISNAQLIEAYVKIRSNKTDDFIKHYARDDEAFREEEKRLKRRQQQEHFRKMRREKLGLPPLGRPPKPPDPNKPKIPPKELKLRCSACGAVGHMKTNRNCPLFGQPLAVQADSSISVESSVPSSSLVDVQQSVSSELGSSLAPVVSMSGDGTKLKFNRALMDAAEKKKKAALKMRFSKSLLGRMPTAGGSGSHHHHHAPLKMKFQRSGASAFGGAPSTSGAGRSDASGSHSHGKEHRHAGPVERPRLSSQHSQDFLGPSQTVQRRRGDPRVSLAIQFEKIADELRTMPEATHFLVPVNKKQVPDYYRLIKNPMDLQKMRMRITNNVYETRESFLADVRQMFENSRLYNGDKHELTACALRLFERASCRITEQEQTLMQLEKAINPLLDDNDIVAFSYILKQAVEAGRRVPHSLAFCMPVDGKKVKGYYDKVKRPMDLSSIEKRVDKHRYTSVVAFMADVKLIHSNSVLFNGESNMFTQIARKIVEAARAELDKNVDQLAELESNIGRALALARPHGGDGAESIDQSSQLSAPSAAGGESVVGAGDESLDATSHSQTMMMMMGPGQPHDDGDDEKPPLTPGASHNPADDEHSTLLEDLAMSGDEGDLGPTDFSGLDLVGGPHSPQPLGDVSPSGNDSIGGATSAMERGGQLNTDLALSDSDEEVEAKRQRTTDYDNMDVM